ncbi:helix-turn-helix domain-containing protein [Roseomonas sp. HJA6]|uniref:Helix-turn-helix domain-containing protein n=2 Tax=Roseomonas alba TaxID=2846776 RepID=A0ABS7ACI5_9PROT|nr:YdaS family helix-turn-helix protein [Neoroseomonas alba]MBW6400011.1 helix-turn-helix domain-containing protein [Neoroseomonas alba]
MAHAPHLERLVAAFGGQNAMARALGTSQGTVWGWLKGGYVPSRRIPEVIDAAARLNPPVVLTHADFFAAAKAASGAKAA